MPIKFKIKELGPIKNSEFEFKPFSIFTGASNMGKSYAAFLVYGFFKILESDKFKDYLEEIYDINSLIEKDDEISITFTESYLNTFINKHISKEIGRIIGNTNVNCEIIINTYFDEIALTKKNRKYFIIKTDNKNIDHKPLFEFTRVSLLPKLHTEIYKLLLKNLFKKEWLGTFILPPAKGAIYGETYTMKKVYANLGMNADFIEQADRINIDYEFFNAEENNKEIIKDFEEIINGKILNENNEIFYKFKNTRIPVRSSASSIKELAPLNDIINKFETDKLTILFEEPEAHLHPEMQRKIALFLAKMVNKGSFLQVTTHSDYFIEEISNLIKLYKIKEDSVKKYEQLLKKLEPLNIKEGMEINPEIVGSYYFKQDQNGDVEIIQKDMSDKNALFETFRNIFTTSADETNSINEVFLSI